MQGNGGQSRRGGGGNGSNGGVTLRKGPWTAEEDEVLMEYVRHHGPRDWSSIRSKGLLPRTGKSCRLRWVNKLKPDLKTGCKFSAEEERIVIELQAKFGNKWARIATYLPGRTDNDVKNFWSTRQKRLARLLQTPLPKSQKNHGKVSAAGEGGSAQNIPPLEGPSNMQCSSAIGSHVNRTPLPETQEPVANAEQMPDDLNHNFLNLFDTTHQLLQPLPPPPWPPVDQQPWPINHRLLPPHLEFPFLPECSELIPGLDELCFQEEFSCQEAPQCMENCYDKLPYFGMDVAGQQQCSVKQEGMNNDVPDDLFDDFPADIFDNSGPPPAASSSTSPRW